MTVRLADKWCTPCHSAGEGKPGTIAAAALYKSASRRPAAVEAHRSDGCWNQDGSAKRGVRDAKVPEDGSHRRRSRRDRASLPDAAQLSFEKLAHCRDATASGRSMAQSENQESQPKNRKKRKDPQRRATHVQTLEQFLASTGTLTAAQRGHQSTRRRSCSASCACICRSSDRCMPPIRCGVSSCSASTWRSW